MARSKVVTAHSDVFRYGIAARMGVVMAAYRMERGEACGAATPDIGRGYALSETPQPDDGSRSVTNRQIDT